MSIDCIKNKKTSYKLLAQQVGCLTVAECAVHNLLEYDKYSTSFLRLSIVSIDKSTPCLGERINFLKNKLNIIDDGFTPELVEKAIFCGNLEIPQIHKPNQLIIPPGLIPFTQMLRSNAHTEAVHFYEYDYKFVDLLTNTSKYVEKLSSFSAVISPDCSLYRDMPLCLQVANTYMNRAIGHYLQSKGIYVIPNIRWGDERSYTTVALPERFAFLGVDKHSIVAISSYGCIRGTENRRYFQEGLEAMLFTLEPEIVLVYGSMPDSVFSAYTKFAQFIHYPDWISSKRKKVG